MGEQGHAAEEELTELSARAREHERAGRRQLARGRADHALREFTDAFEADPARAELPELVLEAHRCRNGAYWALRGYWRWAVPGLSRWLGYPLFAALIAALAAAEAGGGFEFLGRLPQLYPPNALAKTLQVVGLVALLVFVLLHEHKCVWVLERVANLLLVPANVRARHLDERAADEHRRALGYLIAFVALVLVVCAAVGVSMLWTDRLDDLWIVALALPLPLALALALPRGRARTALLVVLALACAAAVGDAVFAWVEPREKHALGTWAMWGFAASYFSVPVVLVLHARARRTRERSLTART